MGVRSIVVGGLVLGAALSGPARLASATFPGGDGLIAFEVDGNLFTVPPGGSTATQLTANGGNHGPRWSPTGRQIAFDRGGDIWTMSPDGTALRHVTAGAAEDTSPTWSPDHQRIAFVRRVVGSRKRNLWVVPAAGGPARLLASVPGGCGATDPSWSPRGRWIAFRQSQDALPPCAKPGIAVLHVSTGKQHIVAPDFGNAIYAFPSEPEFTPDGGSIVISARDANGEGCSDNAYRVGLHSANVEQLTFFYGCEGTSQFHYPETSPSGATVTGVESFPLGNGSGFRLRGTSYFSDHAIADPDWQPLPAAGR